jgi:hypothetical protein
MSFVWDATDYFFISIFFANVILYSWMHFRRSSGKAMNDIKYGARVAMITQVVFIIIFIITILGIWVTIFGLGFR